MSVVLSPVGGVAAQFFTNSGAVLTGGKIYTYAAGTSTPQPAYTTASGTIAWTNPIVLDAAGRVPDGGEIWLTDGVAYKFVLKTSTDVLIATYDNISGINSNFVNFTNDQEIQTATAGQTVFTLTTMAYLPGTHSLSVFVDGVNQYGPGASYAYEETNSTTVTFASGLHAGAEVKFSTTQLQGAGAIDASQVAYDPPFTGAVATNVEAKLAQIVSVMDFGALGDGVTDDTAAIQAAIDAVIASGGGTLSIPAGTYTITNSLNVSDANKINIQGAGKNLTTINRTNNTGPILVLQNASGVSNGNGYYFEWESFRLQYATSSLTTDTNAIGISFETGIGLNSYGFVNFRFTSIEINGAYVCISNDYGAGDPPNVWGWTWDDMVFANFSSRAIYLTNGGVGGFPACKGGHWYIQGRSGLTYTSALVYIDSADGILLDVVETNLVKINADALFNFVGSSRSIVISIFRCEAIEIIGNAFFAFVFNSSGSTILNSVILYNVTVSDGIVASIGRITSTGYGLINSIYLDNITRPSGGTTGLLIANQSDGAGKWRFIGVMPASSGAWLSGDGGGGYAPGSSLYLLNNGLSVLGTKVVGAQGAAVANATGGTTVDTEARTAINTLLARLRAHGLIAT